MLLLTVEVETEQAAERCEHLSRDECLHLWDVSERIKPN